MTTIHAELTAGRDHIVVLAGGLGDPEEVALAARRLKALTPLFTKSDPPGALVVPATWPAVVQLSATFGADWVPGPALCDWVTDQVTQRSTLRRLVYAPPTTLTAYPWQYEGAQMIAATGGALITDEPGTGKTITAILGVVERRAYEPVLVVCPASVIDPWVEAWRTWAPHLRTVAWRGTPKQRSALVGTADVYVVSYETARQDAGVVRSHRPLFDLEAKHVVIDECHLIKNPQADRSQSVRRLTKDAATVVCLSGTPITHNPGDLWTALVCLEPGAWPSKERWVHRYCEVVAGEYKDDVLGLSPYTEAEFRLTLMGQFRRVAKADVLDQLPPKVYSVRTVDLPAKWRKAYDDFEKQMLAELPDDGGELAVMDVLTKVNLLTRLASASADVTVTEEADPKTGELKQHIHLDLKAPSWKVEALLEILAERPGEPVVCFAPSKQLVELAGAAAKKAGLRVGYVVGGQSAKDRTAAVDGFQAGELDLICVTTGAGGVGITLTRARTVVFLQRPWSLVEALQAEDRCHRIGSEQHDSIEVIDIVARNTVDSRIRGVLRERAGQLSDLVQDPRIAAELLGGAHTTEERKAS